MPCATGTSTTATAKPWLLLPTRRISPLRTYQRVPLTSRNVVMRSPTVSTVPLAWPTSTMSPTPYWSSSSMNMPERKSLTRFCAPKPTAMPTMPAEARIGARSTPNSPSTMIAAMIPTTAEQSDRSTEPSVRARWRAPVGGRRGRAAVHQLA